MLNLVTGPGDVVGAALTQSQLVDKIAFTGSTEVGREVMRQAAGTVKKVMLELGGKSPNILLDDAELDLAVDGSLWAIFMHNDLVLLTIAPRYEGYHAAIGRMVRVGDPGAEIRRALDVAIRAQQACGAALRPGIEGRAVEAIGRKIVAAGELGQYFLYSGIHSVGVIEFEPPIFGPSSPAVLKEDMVISIDIPMFNTPWGGLRVESGYLITASGAELLHDTPLRIQR